VDVIPSSSELATAYFAALGKLPQVASMSTVGLYQAALPARRGRPPVAVETMSSPDRTAGVSADRVKVLAGQIYRPRTAGQAMVNQKLAESEHLRPGGLLHLLLIPNNPKTGNPEPGRAFPLAFRVSAVVAFDTQIVPGAGSSSEPTALLSSPFTATAAARQATYGIQAGVRLRPGAGGSVLGLPLAELRDLRVDLADMRPELAGQAAVEVVVLRLGRIGPITRPADDSQGQQRGADRERLAGE